MNQKQKYWLLSLLLGLVLWLGLPAPSYAAESSASAEAKVLHVLNRLSFGPRPGDLETMKSTGIQAYIKSQLTPASIDQPQSLTQQLDSLETLRMTPAELVNEYRQSHRNAQAQQLSPEMRRAAQKRSQQFLQQAVQGRLLRAIESPRKLQEVMVDFWYNHFNVFFQKAYNLQGIYEEQAIRPNVLGKFRALLEATAKHPAMLYYLDNCQNKAANRPGARGKFKGLNENYARELVTSSHTNSANIVWAS